MMPASLPLVYFGKLPSRGDFVRSKSHLNETKAIDDWVSQAVANASGWLEDRYWLHDSPVISFSHINTATKRIITGVLIPSHDSSQRHYPLIGFGICYLDKPKTWMNYLPIKSLAPWDSAYQVLTIARDQTDNVVAIKALSECDMPIDSHASTHYYDFINTTTLERIAQLLSQSKAQLIQQIIAMGLLFLPTLSKGFNGFNKTLYWSLTADKSSAIQLATFWHDLLHGFYRSHELCFNTYLFSGGERYRMVLSFSEPNGQLLSQLPTLDNALPDGWISMDDSDWTEGYIADDIGLSRFQKLLQSEQLNLYDARQLFKQIFLAQ